jgi:hypothetical protein
MFLGWQLAQQADDAKRSLAQKLKERFGSHADPGISLEHGADADVDPALLDALKSRGPSSSRYRLKGEVAQGGMGVILRVWDEDLRRHLAMKVMLDERRRRGLAPVALPRGSASHRTARSPRHRAGPRARHRRARVACSSR